MSVLGPDPDDDDQGMPDEVRAAADTLYERWGAFQEDCDRLGLYLEGQPQVAVQPTRGGPQTVLMVQFTIGAVAFTERVQAPEKNESELEFQKMERSIKDDMFLDERARIEEGLTAGRTLEEIMLGEDDDD